MEDREFERIDRKFEPRREEWSWKDMLVVVNTGCISLLLVLVILLFLYVLLKPN